MSDSWPTPTPYTPDDAPPSPPPPPPVARNRHLGLMAGGAVALVLVLVALAMAFRDGHGSSAGATPTGVSTISQPQGHTVSYSITIRLSNEYSIHTCDGDHGGYSDIRNGAQVEVVDGSGKLLGVGALVQTGGGPIGPTCTYSAVVTVEKSSDGFYRVTSGNNNRGYLTYTEADFNGRKLTVEASLGD